MAEEQIPLNSSLTQPDHRFFIGLGSKKSGLTVPLNPAQ